MNAHDDHTTGHRPSALWLGAIAMVAVVALCIGVALGRGGADPQGSGPRADGSSGASASPGTSGSGSAVRDSPSCVPGPERPAPTVDLGVQASTRTALLSRARVDRLVRLAKRAGASVISTSTSWRYLQPTAGTAPADFRYRGIDRVIDAARAAGLGVRLQLIGMPAWAVDDASRPWSENRPPLTRTELQRWTSFVTAVAQHVADRVDYLEVWNEPNGEQYWPTGPDPAAFADLLAATYAPVKAVAPDLQVISGGLTGNDIGYLQQLYNDFDLSGLADPPLDLVGVHPFTGSASPDTVDPARTYSRDPYGLVDEDFTGYKSLHEVTQQHGDGARELYIGAFGYGDRPSRGEPGVPDDVRAGYVQEALEQVTCTPYVRALSWYYLHPTPFDPAAWTLLDRDLRPNATYRAFVAWTEAVAASGAQPAAGR